MKEFKYISFKPYSLIYLFLVLYGAVFDKYSYLHEIFLIEHHFLIFLLLCLFSVHTIVISRSEISANLYLMPIFKYKRKTWREIKHYAHVKEMYDYGRKSATKTLWFIDYNDKVCFRVKKSSILKFKSSDFLQNVDRFEDKLIEEIQIDYPYLMSRGITKVPDLNKKEMITKPD